MNDFKSFLAVLIQFQTVDMFSLQIWNITDIIGLILQTKIVTYKSKAFHTVTISWL